MAKDAFVNTSIYDKQTGNTTGTTQIAAGILEVNGVPLGLAVTITAASGSANVSNVTIQVQDGAGNNIGKVFDLAFWLSDAATGAGLTATTASGGIAVSTGTQVQAKTAAKALEILSDATGKAVVAITDTAKTGFFPCVEAPGTGLLAIGAQLVAGSYG